MCKRPAAHIRWSLLLALGGIAAPTLTLAADVGAAAPVAQEGPTPLEIKAAQAVLELADPSIAVRDQATRRLMEMGRSAESVLERAAASADPEISVRAREILLDFRYGLYPETPADIAALIRTYRRGKDMEKRAVIRALQRMGRRGAPILVRLAGAEQDRALSSDIRRDLSARPGDAAAAYLAEENHAAAEELLEAWWPTSSDGAQSYATYWMLRGKLDEKIAEHRKPLDAVDAAVAKPLGPGGADPATTRMKLLVHLYRAKAHLDGASWAAQRSEDRDLLENILLARRDFKTLAMRLERELVGNHVGKLGFLAAYQRLAGDEQGLAKTIERIGSVQTPGESDVWHVAEALLLNGQVEEGIKKLAEGGRQASAFKLLAARQEYEKALALSETVNGLGAEEVLLKAHLGRMLHQLGERQKAREVLEPLREALKRLRDFKLWLEVVEAEAAVSGGDRTRAIQLAAEAYAQPGGAEHLRELVGKVFPRREAEALAWVMYFSQATNDEKNAQLRAGPLARAALQDVLAQTAEVFDQAYAGTKDGAALDKLADRVRSAALRMPSPPRELVLRGAGQTLLAAGRAHEAVRCWEALAQVSEAQGDHLLLADHAARQGDWTLAAELYTTAIEKDRSRAYARYMRGHALTKLGRQEEGKRVMSAAMLIPLADEAERYLLARSLAEVGLEADADAQHEVVMKTGDFEYWMGDAQRHVGWRLNGQGEFAAAADVWEMSLLDVLHTNTTFREEATYLATAALVHRTRAMALVKAGKVSEALKEAEAALNYLPGDLNVAIELVPMLERGGHIAQAKTLLEREVKSHAALCQRWPSSPSHHNAMAWMLARVRKDLDRALVHAQKAVELEPQSCAILDTLAEVHFQRGDKAKAIEGIQRCIELEPWEARHRAALKRFETQGPQTPPPPE